MSDLEGTAVTIQEIESILAEMLETYAALRSRYIHPPEPGASLDIRASDTYLIAEVDTYRNAARLLREHRDEHSGMGLPSWLWGEWAAAEKAFTARLGGGVS